MITLKEIPLMKLMMILHGSNVVQLSRMKWILMRTAQGVHEEMFVCWLLA